MHLMLNGEATKHGTWTTSGFMLHQTSVNILYSQETKNLEAKEHRG